MRRPVDAPYVITTEFGAPDSYAKFGFHSGVDYAKSTGSSVYAPVSGNLTQVVSPTGGNMVVIFDGRFYHRLMHNSQFIKGNGGVSEGEVVAKVGTTGLSTGPHCHWDINKQGTYPDSFAQFISPADWLAGKYNVVTPPPVAGGNNMFQTDAEVQEAYLMLRGNPGTLAERQGWIGQPKQRFFQLGKPEADQTRLALANTQKQVNALTAQVNSLTTQVTQLKTEVATLAGKVKTQNDTIAAKDAEIATLKAQVATGGNSEDTALLNGFGEFLRKLIVRLGLKG